MNLAKDLTKEAPRSPSHRIGGYSILARMIDKGRADLNGTIGEYHYNCGLDQKLFGFKEIDHVAVKELLSSGASDEQVVAYFNAQGAPRTEAEIKAFSDAFEAARPYDNPESREWFEGVCLELGLDPSKSTIVDYLETDDRVTFKNAA
jgi:hypothetical protein